jgi:hypothetical protein
MKSTRKTEILAGILFLTAMVASIVGGGLLETTNGGKSNSLIITGIILEIINALAVFGIGIVLFPVLKDFQRNAAKIYLALRIFEALACLAAPLVLVIFTNSNDLRMFFTGKIIPLFFCSGALVLYYLLYAYRLLPRFISIWGLFGVLGIIILNLVKFETSAGMLLALPIILNEIFLGIWLIAKGFYKTKL